MCYIQDFPGFSIGLYTPRLDCTHLERARGLAAVGPGSYGAADIGGAAGEPQARESRRGRLPGRLRHALPHAAGRVGRLGRRPSRPGCGCARALAGVTPRTALCPCTASPACCRLLAFGTRAFAGVTPDLPCVPMQHPQHAAGFCSLIGVAKYHEHDASYQAQCCLGHASSHPFRELHALKASCSPLCPMQQFHRTR